MATRSKYGMLRVSKLALAVSLAFNGAAQAALPTGAQVASGSAQIGTVGNTMTVTNSPSAIINWQSFSIGQSEAVKFVQQSASSSVLNRVVGGQMSAIMGRLTSNGQVLLINPAGVLVGAGAVVDTASFFASTLKILDQDFLAGKIKFQGDADSGKITNQGWIRTGYGGQVVLIAPNIENSGIIQAPGGKILLAAGQKVTLGTLDMDGLGFQVQAPTDSALNLGQLIADGGVVQVFAGSLKHSGDIRANSLTRDSGGEIVLKARGDVELTTGSTTVANGRTGGTIRIESETGTARVAGDVSATGSSSAGGGIDVLGEKVVLTGNATLDASGATGGGVIRAGGDWQGANPDVKNAQSAFVGAGVTLKADATDQGDGGKVVVWSDGDTRFLGSLSAQGGPNGGNGGNAEVSGKGDLLFIGGANLGAPKGTAGSLLLDPLDLFVDNAGGLNPFIIDENTDFPDHAVTVAPATLAAIVGNVTLFASRDMRLNSPITLTGAGQGLAANAGRDLTLGNAITTNNGAVSLTAGRSILTSFVAGTPSIAAGTGAVTAASGTGGLSINDITSAGSVSLSSGGGTLAANQITASGPVTLTSVSAIDLLHVTSTGALTMNAQSFVDTSNITSNGGNITVNAGGYIATQNISSGGGAIVLNAGDYVATNAINSNGGNVTVQAAANAIEIQGALNSQAGAGPSGGAVSLTSVSSYITTGNVTAGNGTVSMSGNTNTSDSNNPTISAGTINTSGSVSLVASNGDISAGIDNAATVTATATRTTNINVSVNLSSNTTLNATNVSANTSICSSASSCRSATVNLSGAQGVNVGTVTANAAATTTSTTTAPFQSRNRSVTIDGQNGSTNAISGASQITATDVTLQTSQGSGGGVGAVGPALNVNVERTFTFRPNGAFNVALNGSGPNRLDMQLGTGTYSGTLTKVGQGVPYLSASATPTVVTVSDLTISGGFDTPVFNQLPSISLSVSNGDLVADSVSVPRGDQVGFANTIFASPTIRDLPVTLTASGNLTVGSFTRQSGGATGKTTTFTANGASALLTVDSISGSRDDITFNATGGASTVGAQNDGAGLEVVTSGNVIVNTNKIGTSAFTNPLDIAAGTITLNSSGADAWIGSGAAPTNPVGASTGNLTINAAGAFNVDTRSADLTNLTVTATPSAVGAGGIAQVTLNGTAYAFASDGSNFTLANWTAPATQFDGGTLSFTSTAGNLTLNNIDFSASNGSLNVTTRQSGSGTITQIGSFDLGSGYLTLQADGVVTLANPTMGGLSAGNANSSFGTGCGVGGYSFCGVASFTAGNITDPTGFGSFSVSSRGAINTGNLEVGNVSFTAYTGGISTGTIGTAVRPANDIYLATGLYYGFGGSVQTGAIESYYTTIYADGNITIGTLVTPAAINAANPGAGSVYLYSYPGGNVTVGNIDAGSTYIDVNGSGTITTGNINANAATTFPNDISLRSYTAVTTGALDANQISISSNCCGIRPSISVGAIGGNRPGTSVDLYGSDITVGGALSLDAGGSGQSLSVNAGGNLTINGNVSLGQGGSLGSPMRLEAGGILDINGGNAVITAVDGSFLQLNAGNTTPFQFASISAGPTGWVTVNAPAGIRQTLATGSGGGITAATVTLNADAAGSLIEGPTTLVDPLTVRGTTSLTVTTGGAVAIDRTDGANPIPLLTNVDISQSDATQLFSLTGYSGGQSVGVAYDAVSGAQVNATTPSGAPMSFRYQNSGGANSDITGLGIATMNGTVILDSTSGNVTAGNIDTTDTGLGSQISISAGQALNIDAALNSGAGQVILTGSSIGGAGSVTSAYAGSTGASAVSAEAFAGDIGTAGTHLAINANSVYLEARRSGVGGDVFAGLTGTSIVSLTADNGFTVASDTTLTNLGIATRGDGVGDVTLAAPGQSFGFSREGAAVKITTVSSPTPLATLGVSVTNGNLRVVGTGVSSIAADSLILFTSGNLDLDGTGAPVILTSAGPQQFVATGNLSVTGAATFTSGATQQFRANGDTVFQAQAGSISANAVNHVFVGRDIRLLGGASTGDSVTVAATGSQSFNATRHIDLLGGSADNASVGVSLNGSGSQSLYADGNLMLAGGGTLGANADASVALTKAGDGTQRLDAGGSISLTGGAGDRGSVTVANSGSGNQEFGDDYCCSNPTDNLTVQGGDGVDSFALVNAAGRQFIKPVVSLNVLGGGGEGAYARINTDATTSSGTSISSGPQIVGYSGTFDCCSGDRINTIALTAGAGTGAYAEISSAGSQRIDAQTSLTMTGSAADGAFARIRALANDVRTGATTLNAGTGSGADATIEAVGTEANRPSFMSFLQIVDPSSLSLSAGGTAGANTAVARISSGGSQSVSSSPTALTAGIGPDSSAEITAVNQQTVSLGNLIMLAGAGDNASVRIFTSAATGSQTVSASTTSLTGGSGQLAKAIIESGSAQSLNFSTLTITAGTNRGADASLKAVTGQSVNAGNTTVAGGSGTAAGDAMASIVNDSGAQSLSAGSLTVRSGADYGRALIATQGSGQTINAGAITVTTSAGANNGGTTFSSIEHQGSGTQTITSSSINVNNQHVAGRVGIYAPGDQIVGSSGVVTVQVTGGAGTAEIVAAAGTQTVRGNSASTADAGQAASGGSANGGVRVQVAGGSGGTARIAASAGTQTILGQFVDINTSASGTAAITASGNQWVRTTNGTGSGVGSLRVAAIGGGSATLSTDGNQLLQIDYPELMQTGRDGRITVGSAGANGSSWISAVNQDVFARSITVLGGAAGGNSKINVSGVQNISLVSSTATPNAGITVTGGAGGTALIDPVTQTILSNGLISVMGGSAGTDVFGGILATGNQTILVTNSTAANGILVQGGGGANADGRIATSGPQTITVTTPSLTGGSIQVSGGAGSGADGEISAGGNQSIAVTTPSSFGGILVDGGGGSNAFGQITTSGNQTINVTMTTATATPGAVGGVEVQGGNGSGAVGQIAAAGTQYIFVSTAAPGPADILVEGGSGVDAFGQITAGSMLIGTSGGIELTPGSGPNADATFTSGQTIPYGCGVAFTCVFPVLPGDYSINGIADFGGAPQTIQVDLATFTGVFPSSEDAPTPTPPGFLFDSLILWDPTLPLTDEEREEIALGRRLPVCN